jgi:ELWxxDGT repeat protein
MLRRTRSWGDLTATFLVALCASGGAAATALAQSPALVRAFPGGGDPPDTLHALGPVLLFAAADSATGREPWRSDGTAAGTVLVRDVWPGPDGAHPFEFGTLGSFAYFNGHGGATGRELWRTDGTTAGTTLVKDIRPGSGWSSPTGFVVSGSAIYFVADNGTTGWELWRSDGTAAGTTLVRDIRVGSGSSGPYGLTDVGGTLFFWADDGVTGYELWKSDGTPGGTALVRDINPGADPSIGGSPVSLGGALLFSANDGVHGEELWRSDGTSAGTTMVRDIHPGSASSEPSARVNVVQGRFHYFAADDGVNGRELWVTDGTPAGTRIVRDINPGTASSGPSGITVLGDTVFLRANDGVSGRELLVSDGTASGTRLVLDIRPGASGSNVGSPTVVGGVLYFTADDGATGTELWRSDGTAAGTHLVADLWPGGAGAFPESLVAVGDTLFFTAEDGSHGRALWRHAASPAAPVLSGSPEPLVIGAANALAGANFTAGSVVKLYVATGGKVVTYGPYVPSAWRPTSLTWTVPASVVPGSGFASVQVVNTDTGHLVSNVVGALLFGSAAAGLPTITRIGGASLGPAELSIGVAHIDTVVGKGATVTIGGTGFADPVVSVFTATGKVDLVPTAWTATSVSVVLPATAPTGPGTFRVVNRPSYRESNAVAAVIGAVPTISGVSVTGGLVTVTGTGFCALTVINLFNVQGGGVVNLGGLGPGGTAKIPLLSVTDTQFSFARPAGAVTGPAFVEVLNPPFIPFSSSGSDPDGAFTLPAAAPLWTEERSDVTAVVGDGDDDSDRDGRAGAAGDESPGRTTRELVRWTRPVGAHAAGDVLTAAARRAALSGRPNAGARSTRALLAGDGSVSWTVRADAGDVAFGFGHTDAGASLADLAFAWRLDPATRELQVYERGVRQAALGTYAPGDRLRIAVRGGAVEYARNGVLVFTSKAAPRYPLVVDASLGSPDATLQGVRLSGRLGTVIDWAAAPGVTVTSMAVAADGGGARAVVVASEGAGAATHPDTTDADGTWAGPNDVADAAGAGGTGVVGRAGTGAGDRAATGGRPYTVGGGCDPVGGCAVGADLRGAAGIGFGATACDYCIVRVDDLTVQVRHAGLVRGTWPAPAGTRVRVEMAGGGLIRYWAGDTLLDQWGKGDSFLFPKKETVPFFGWLGSPQSAITRATSEP